jgi:probable F420-dependent oxidoreductase
MQFGVSIFPTDYSMDVGQLGRAVEERGFDALLFPEHTHIPTNRRSPWPGGPDLPKHYWHTIDPFVVSGVVAANTTRLRFGTGICLVVERDPITTAREVASADFVSGGRFLFGIGSGWNEEEMENHGTDPRQRFKLMRERMLAMKTIWSQDEPEFHGQFVNFDPIWQWPKPIQRPNPPVLVGGNGKRVLDRVLEYGDVWMPNHGRGPIEERIATLQQRAAAQGRSNIPVWVFGCPPHPEAVEQYIKAGVAECLFALPSAGADELLPRLDQWATLAGQYATA